MASLRRGLASVRYYVTQAMSVEASIRSKLTEAFAPSHIFIRNDSSKHAHHAAMVAQGGGSGETHFFVELGSEACQGKVCVDIISEIHRRISRDTALSTRYLLPSTSEACTPCRCGSRRPPRSRKRINAALMASLRSTA